MARSQRSAKIQARKTMSQLKDTSPVDDSYDKSIAKGGVACPFPWRLHEMLAAAEREGLTDLVAWQKHGRSFTVYNPKEFADKIMSRFFSQTKYASFQRQLNLYGFSRLAHGRDKGAYFHLCFVRHDPEKVREMVRRKIKGTKVRRALSADEEPNFYEDKWQPDSATSRGLEEMMQRVSPEPFAGEKTDGLLPPSPKSTAMVSPTTVPEKENEAEASSPTTWDAFNDVRDNDFWLLDGTGFFDEGILDEPLSGNQAGTVPRTTSKVSLDQLCSE